ncbi:adenylate/guanylate cyclase domain-containing protein [Mycobacterium sp. BK086]|uniref:AAA family ATPase n=1 Tax=Mycobacterium sp. BK086 TaxID=2512165 RepID=UPI0025701640|nr:adenylate/guanylate cyclase domain-containing protein [Mycobacterium sp. BK086]
MAVDSATCRVCGAQPRPGARFCDSCGSPLTDTEMPAEYKQVTVLFADVVRSMDLAAALGPERLREIMTNLVERATGVVTRYGGTVDKFTGDGIMAIFGAPAALEDHAFRACLAALGLQNEARQLAAEIEKVDGLQFELRVGLNSGQVITGDITSSPTSYTAVGEQVGLAQRMESVAPPGGVMLSESTAQLVDGTVELADAEQVHVKGAQAPMTARRLLGVSSRLRRRQTAETTLVGRTWELASIAGMLDEAIGGAGGVVNLVGPPGIGKSRIVQEVTARAAELDVDVIAASCESHTSDLPFHAASALLAAALDVAGMDKAAARAQVRERVPETGADDLLLVDDLLGIADRDAQTPAIEADARRRRLTSLLDAALMARRRPTMFVLEDAHWIDEPSEALLSSFLEVAPQTPSLVLITFRPEYRGALAKAPGAQTITLRPLSNTQTSALTSELLGRHSSVRELVDHIAERAAGNPFFAEEIVRDLAERGVLEGVQAGYSCTVDIADIRVPATLQAAIAARIDRLGTAAKRTLSAASVIGSRFNAELLEGLGVTPAFSELLDAELVTRVQFTSHDDYAFKHPLIRTVAYESQLKSDRTGLHRQLAALIQTQSCGDDRAAAVAEHFEAAGDLRTAFDWHMRAGQWLTNRDIAAARASWQRARQVADELPNNSPDIVALRIAPRTLLCASAYRGGGRVADTGFDELRVLCEQADDRRSLAIAMAGLPVSMTLLNKHHDAVMIAGEQEQLVESIGDPLLTVGLLHGVITARLHAGQAEAAARTAQRVIDTAGGDATMGELLIGSPLAQATMLRGVARCTLGRPGWRTDFAEGIALATGSDAVTRVIVVSYPYGMLLLNGVFVPDDTFFEAVRNAFSTAEQSGDDFTLGMAGFAYGAASIARDDIDPAIGAQVLEEVLDSVVGEENGFRATPATVALASYRARFGNVDGAIRMARTLVDSTADTGEMILRGPATSVLVQALLQRGTGDDVQEARTHIERLAAVPTDPGFVLFDVPLLRLRALLARSDGDDARYRDFRDRYRAMANALDFQGHMALAEAMD